MTKSAHTLELSVVLAVHNEESCIGRCLQAVQAIADEIIVVDGDSTDATVSIAKKFGAKVISTTNKPNFHLNKKMAIEAASGKLVLQLDADEVVDATLLKEIAQIKQQKAWETADSASPTAWQIPRKNFLLGRWLSKGGQYPDYVIRLFIAGKASIPAKDVHEQLSVEGAIGTLSGHLLHYANPTFSDYVRKANRYTSFTAQQWQAAGKSISLGNTFFYCVYMPIMTTAKLFLRHRGYVDGLAGFVFAAGSGLHFLFAYLKLWELYETKN